MTDLHVWVPWLLATGNVCSLWLTGRRSRLGFLVLIAAQTAFVAYAVRTGQTGFLLQNFVMIGMSVVGWHRWGPDAKPVDQANSAAPRCGCGTQ